MRRRWAHLRISFWPLLMNLKNNYLFKKRLKWPNKKRKNVNIYNYLHILKKILIKHQEILSFYTCIPKV